MYDELYRVCPECAGEYRLEIEVCADCEVPLVFPAALEEEDAPSEPDLDLPEEIPFAGPLHQLAPSDDLVCVCCRYLGALQTVSRALDEAGIAHCMEPVLKKRTRRFSLRSLAGCLYVQPADGDAAAAIDARLWSTPLVDDPELRAELTVCPACGASFSLGATECRGCGLVLGSGPDLVDQICERCGAAIGVETPSCPNCGSVLPTA